MLRLSIALLLWICILLPLRSQISIIPFDFRIGILIVLTGLPILLNRYSVRIFSLLIIKDSLSIKVIWWKGLSISNCA